MGVDLLDIVYRLEKTFSIRIDREGFFGPMSEWDEALRSGQKTQQQLFDKYSDRLTVKFLCDLVERRIREKNEGIDTFPDFLAETKKSVHGALAEFFDITNPSLIEGDDTLAALCEKAKIPSPRWSQLYRIRKSDTPTLKLIKMQVSSRELISSGKALWQSITVPIILYVLLLLFGSFLLSRELVGLLAIAVWSLPIVLFFERRFVINRFRSRRPPRITVDELIQELVKLRPDHSVRADGISYSRAEIEQAVAEALIEALAVKPEEIKPEARIIKDLGAE